MPVQKSYTRVTLALDIIRRIATGPFSGYHELNVMKHRIDLHDVIAVAPARESGLSCSNPAVPAGPENLCLRAVALMQKRFGVSENVQITIEKNIPVKGGLAGGSANAATVLDLLNRLWSLGLDREQRASLGREIGMDVPYYFTGGTACDTEATGRIEPVHTNLVFDFVLVIPPFGVSTAEAYRGIFCETTGKETGKTAMMKTAFARNDRDGVFDTLHNDFEPTVFSAHSSLAAIRQELLAHGCRGAVMSGSGSTMIGIARDPDHAALVTQRMGRNYTVIRASTYYQGENAGE